MISIPPMARYPSCKLIHVVTSLPMSTADSLSQLQRCLCHQRTTNRIPHKLRHQRRRPLLFVSCLFSVPFPLSPDAQIPFLTTTQYRWPSCFVGHFTEVQIHLGHPIQPPILTSGTSNSGEALRSRILPGRRSVPHGPQYPLFLGSGSSWVLLRVL